jgi:hypothetical protein
MLTIPGARPQSGTIVMAKIAEMHADLRCVPGKVEVEIVRYRAHHCVAFTHERAHALCIANVERCGDEALARIWRKKIRKMSGVDVSETDFRDFVILQQIISTGGALQPRPEYQHSHYVNLP